MRLSDIIQSNLTLTFKGLTNQELLAEIQLKLTGLGYDPGVPNGQWNIKTEAALLKFCSDHHLDCIAQNNYDVGFALALNSGGRIKVSREYAHAPN